MSLELNKALRAKLNKPFRVLDIEPTAQKAFRAFDRYLQKYGTPMDAMFELTANYLLNDDEVNVIVDKLVENNKISPGDADKIKEYCEGVALELIRHNPLSIADSSESPVVSSDLEDFKKWVDKYNLDKIHKASSVETGMEDGKFFIKYYEDFDALKSPYPEWVFDYIEIDPGFCGNAEMDSEPDDVYLDIEPLKQRYEENFLQNEIYNIFKDVENPKFEWVDTICNIDYRDIKIDPYYGPQYVVGLKIESTLFFEPLNEDTNIQDSDKLDDFNKWVIENDLDKPEYAFDRVYTEGETHLFFLFFDKHIDEDNTYGKFGKDPLARLLEDHILFEEDGIFFDRFFSKSFVKEYLSDILNKIPADGEYELTEYFTDTDNEEVYGHDQIDRFELDLEAILVFKKKD